MQLPIDTIVTNGWNYKCLRLDIRLRIVYVMHYASFDHTTFARDRKRKRETERKGERQREGGEVFIFNVIKLHGDF